MILQVISHLIGVFGAPSLLTIFLLLHLCFGFVMPYRPGARPWLFTLMEMAGVDFEHRLNRENRPQSARFMRGVIVMLLLAGLGCLVGRGVQYVSSLFREGWIVQLLFLSVCINFMTPLKLVRQLLRYLRANEPQKAADILQAHAVMPFDRSDVHAVVRRGIEFIAVSLNQFLVAPSFWFLVAGPLGLALYTTISALHQAFGLPDPRRKFFGRGVRIADSLLNIVPSFLTALLLCVSSVFVSKSNPIRALVTIQQGSGTYMPYLGWPLAAIAGGLGITLGGSVRFSEHYVQENNWIGPKNTSARLTAEDLSRAAMIQYVFFVCMLGMISVLLLMGI